MSECQKCKSDRVLTVSCKCSDSCSMAFKDLPEHHGYVPEGVGVDDGEDYIYFKVCLDCGQMQGEWPKPDPKF